MRLHSDFSEFKPSGQLSRVGFASLPSHPGLALALRREFYPRGPETGDHIHTDFFAFYAVRSGRGLHVIDGSPYAITRGDLYLLPIGANHAYRDYQALEIDAFYFQSDLFSEEQLTALRELAGFWKLFEAPDEHRLHLRPEDWRAVEAEIEELRAEWAQRDAASTLLVRDGFFRLLVHIARTIEASSPPINRDAISHGTRDAVAEAIRLMEHDCATPLSVASLAARCFLSSSHFSTLFTRETGVPPATYHKRLRLERARTLLREGELSATQIALETGFSDAAHFSHAFRSAYGLSPSQFRRSLTLAKR